MNNSAAVSFTFNSSFLLGSHFITNLYKDIDYASYISKFFQMSYVSVLSSLLSCFEYNFDSNMFSNEETSMKIFIKHSTMWWSLSPCWQTLSRSPSPSWTTGFSLKFDFPTSRPAPRKYQISKIELYNQKKSCLSTLKEFKKVFKLSIPNL